jgi:hypothetical protein
MSFHDLIAAYGQHEGDDHDASGTVIVEKERKPDDGLGLVNYDYDEVCDVVNLFFNSFS